MCPWSTIDPSGDSQGFAVYCERVRNREPPVAAAATRRCDRGPTMAPSNPLLPGVTLMAQPFTLIAAAFTPFAADGSLDRSKIAVQRDRLVADGVDGAFICGTTGEGASLTTEERMAVTAAWTAGATTGFKVIAHVGHASAQEGAKLARHAESVGAQAFATVAPYFLKPRNAREVVDALAVVAAGAPSPRSLRHNATKPAEKAGRARSAKGSAHSTPLSLRQPTPCPYRRVSPWLPPRRAKTPAPCTRSARRLTTASPL